MFCQKFIFSQPKCPKNCYQILLYALTASQQKFLKWVTPPPSRLETSTRNLSHPPNPSSLIRKLSRRAHNSSHKLEHTDANGMYKNKVQRKTIFCYTKLCLMRISNYFVHSRKIVIWNFTNY